MSEPDPEPTPVVENRIAVATAVASLVVLLLGAGLYWSGAIDPSVPERLEGTPLLPVLSVGLLVAIVLVVWSWDRVASLFD